MSFEPLLYAVITIFAIGKTWGSLSQRLTSLESGQKDLASQVGRLAGRLDNLPCGTHCPENQQRGAA